MGGQPLDCPPSCMQCFVVDIQHWNPDEQLFDRLVQSLDDESVAARLRRFKRREDALRSLIGKLLPRWYLVHRSDRSIPWGAVQERQSDRGRPYMTLAGTGEPLASFDYNISHDGDLVVMLCRAQEGVCTDSTGEVRLGVDVMQLRLPAGFVSVAELEETVADFLCPAEREHLRSVVRTDDKLAILLRYWTAKEAISKALGVGLGHPLADLDTSGLHSQDSIDLMIQCQTCHVQLFELQEPAGPYLVAMAALSNSKASFSVKPERLEAARLAQAVVNGCERE